MSVILISSEGKSFRVSVDDIKIASLIKLQMEVHADEIPNVIGTAQKITLPTINEFHLGKIVEFCQHYQSDKMNKIQAPLKSANMSDHVQPWYANFIDVDHLTLAEMIIASEFLDIGPLNELLRAKFASFFYGISAEEIFEEYEEVQHLMGNNAPSQQVNFLKVEGNSELEINDSKIEICDIAPPAMPKENLKRKLACESDAPDLNENCQTQVLNYEDCVNTVNAKIEEVECVGYEDLKATKSSKRPRPIMVEETLVEEEKTSNLKRKATKKQVKRRRKNFKK